jgi:DNA primase
MGAAADARAYLDRRGLNGEALQQFEIGFAPNDRAGLKSALMGRGISEQQLVDTGLIIKPDDGGTSYDRFRGRIMFPIRDARGRCVAFGGRAMDSNARAKYLNSPETILFDKGRSLYNHGPARSAVGRGQPLIVAEGYMDVIALVRAGFEGAVAPLGTAITENQLAMMWQITPEPIIALDGDKAGLRAAYRLIDLAMPLLQTGRALRFALMPEGQDPDDLLRAKGAGAVQSILDNAMPLVELLWRRETEGQTFDSPDRKAALDKRLRGSTSQIQDQNLRSHYDQAIKDLRWDFFRAARSFKSGSTRNVLQTAGASTKGSVLAAGEGDVAQYLREAVILAILIRFPELVYEYLDELAMLDFEHGDHPSMLRILMRHCQDMDFDPSVVLSENMGADPLEKFMTLGHLQVVPCLRRSGDIEMARLTLKEELGKLGAHRGLEAELQESSQIPEDGLDTWVLHRLAQAADAANRAQRADQDDQTQYDVADNGARISRDERNKLDDLIGAIRFQKTKK